MSLCACGCGSTPPLATRTRPSAGYVKGQPIRFCPGHHRGAYRGGRVDSHGYVAVLTPHHPRAHNGYVKEHILVVEAALGHYLDPRHEVHHFDENKANNTRGNLVACEDRAYHALLHQRTRAMRACGNPRALRCDLCGSYERQDDIAVGKNYHGGRRGQHRSCRRALRKSMAAA